MNYFLVAKVFKDKGFILKEFINLIILKLVIKKVIINLTLKT